MTTAVTGATGFIGKALVRSFTVSGEPVIALGRRPVPGVESRSFTLGLPVAPAALDGVETLIHCAWDLGCKRLSDIYARNVVGSAQLLRAANSAGVRRVVFISSMSAYAGTSQIYGRTKMETEHLVSDLGGVSLRLGLVWSEEPGGMAGAVQRLSRLPVVPVLGARSYQFTVHATDALRAIHVAASAPDLTGVLGVANPAAVPTPALLRGLAAMSGAPAGRLVSIPWQPIYWLMRVAELARVPLPLRADSVLGLVRPAGGVPRVEEWQQRGVALRRFPAPPADASPTVRESDPDEEGGREAER